MATTVPEAKLALGALIDQFGVASVLVFMSEIAGDKVTHIRENLQDDERTSLALHAWAKASIGLDHLAERTTV